MQFNLKIKNKIVLGSSLALILVVIQAFIVFHSIESMVKNANWEV